MLTDIVLRRFGGAIGSFKRAIGKGNFDEEKPLCCRASQECKLHPRTPGLANDVFGLQVIVKNGIKELCRYAVSSCQSPPRLELLVDVAAAMEKMTCTFTCLQMHGGTVNDYACVLADLKNHGYLLQSELDTKYCLFYRKLELINCVLACLSTMERKICEAISKAAVESSPCKPIDCCPPPPPKNCPSRMVIKSVEATCEKPTKPCPEKQANPCCGKPAKTSCEKPAKTCCEKPAKTCCEKPAKTCEKSAKNCCEKLTNPCSNKSARNCCENQAENCGEKTAKTCCEKSKPCPSTLGEKMLDKLCDTMTPCASKKKVCIKLKDAACQIKDECKPPPAPKKAECDIAKMTVEYYKCIGDGCDDSEPAICNRVELDCGYLETQELEKPGITRYKLKAVVTSGGLSNLASRVKDPKLREKLTKMLNTANCWYQSAATLYQQIRSSHKLCCNS